MSTLLPHHPMLIPEFVEALEHLRDEEKFFLETYVKPEDQIMAYQALHKLEDLARMIEKSYYAKP